MLDWELLRKLLRENPFGERVPAAAALRAQSSPDYRRLVRHLIYLFDLGCVAVFRKQDEDFKLDFFEDRRPGGEAPAGPPLVGADLPFLELVFEDDAKIEIENPDRFPSLKEFLGQAMPPGAAAEFPHVLVFSLARDGCFWLLRARDKRLYRADTFRLWFWIHLAFWQGQRVLRPVSGEERTPVGSVDVLEQLSSLGKSHEIRLVADQLSQFYGLGYRGPVFVQGEWGTGKEIVVDWLWERLGFSENRVRVHCPTFPGERLAVEFFGGVNSRNAGRSMGRVSQFSEGVFLLEEIGYSDREFQERLSRALAEGYCLNGLGKVVPFRFTVYFTSSVDLEGLVEEGRFDPELYRLLARNRVFLPPLRRRADDALYLAERQLAALNLKYNRQLRLGQEMDGVLRDEYWRGNAVELRERVKYAFLLSAGGILEPGAFRASQSIFEDGFFREMDPAGQTSLNLKISARKIENEKVLEAWFLCGGNQVQMGNLLGLTRGSLQYRLRHLGIK